MKNRFLQAIHITLTVILILTTYLPYIPIMAEDFSPSQVPSDTMIVDEENSAITEKNENPFSSSDAESDETNEESRDASSMRPDEDALSDEDETNEEGRDASSMRPDEDSLSDEDEDLSHPDNETDEKNTETEPTQSEEDLETDPHADTESEILDISNGEETDTTATDTPEPSITTEVDVEDYLRWMWNVSPADADRCITLKSSEATELHFDRGDATTATLPVEKNKEIQFCHTYRITQATGYEVILSNPETLQYLNLSDQSLTSFR